MKPPINNLVQFKSIQPQNAENINYNPKRNTISMPTQNLDNDMFLLQAKEQQKAEKKAKKQDQWNKAGVLAQIGIAAGFLLTAGVSIFAFTPKGRSLSAKAAAEAAIASTEATLQRSSTKAEKLVIVDVSKEKSFEELCLPNELKKVVEDLKTKIERQKALAKKGYNKSGGIILYGEPGGGKNAFTYALTKLYQKIFPGSELIMVDVNKFKGMYNGQTENNIINFVDNIKKKANENPDKKFVVFLDEFDSIAKKATGSANENSSESFQNAFKTTLTEIMDIPNVDVIAATNKAKKGETIDKYLDSAIANRFPEKIYVPLPTKEQLKNAFVEHYKKLPQGAVDLELTQDTTKVLDDICEYISRPENHASFRDFTNIIDHSKIISEGPTRVSGTPISGDDLIDAVIKHADGNNWNITALNNFRKAHNRPTVTSTYNNNTHTVETNNYPRVVGNNNFLEKFFNFFKF